MNVLFVLIPLALLVAGGFLAAFVWSVRTGQLDDTDTPAMRMLTDDDAPARAPLNEAAMPAQTPLKEEAVPARVPATPSAERTPPPR